MSLSLASLGLTWPTLLVLRTNLAPQHKPPLNHYLLSVFQESLVSYYCEPPPRMWSKLLSYHALQLPYSCTSCNASRKRHQKGCRRLLGSSRFRSRNVPFGSYQGEKEFSIFFKHEFTFYFESMKSWKNSRFTPSDLALNVLKQPQNEIESKLNKTFFCTTQSKHSPISSLFSLVC